MVHYFTFLYFVWKAIVLFGYSYLYEMKHKKSRLSLMQADFHLSNAATSFGFISRASELKNELEVVLTDISFRLKKQTSRNGKVFLSLRDWEKFQKSRFHSIQEFYLTSLYKCYAYSLQNDSKRNYLFTLSIAFVGDLFYKCSDERNIYFDQIKHATPWEVTYVRPYNNESEVTLPIYSKKYERRDF